MAIPPPPSANGTTRRNGRSRRSGPFDHWPTGLGFEYFYGFIGGESSKWEPRLYRDTIPVENDRRRRASTSPPR